MLWNLVRWRGSNNLGHVTIIWRGRRRQRKTGEKWRKLLDDTHTLFAGLKICSLNNIQPGWCAHFFTSSVQIISELLYVTQWLSNLENFLIPRSLLFNNALMYIKADSLYMIPSCPWFPLHLFANHWITCEYVTNYMYKHMVAYMFLLCDCPIGWSC